MSVTFSKISSRIQGRLQLGETPVDLTQAQIQALLRCAFTEIGTALASGEDVFLEGFGRFFPDYKPPRKIKSGLTNTHYKTKKKVFVRFTPFDKLSLQVQAYLKTIGVDVEEENDGESDTAPPAARK